MIVKNIFKSIKLLRKSSLSECIIKVPEIFQRYKSTTIYALASGSNQRCGVAVVRLSGTDCLNILLKLTKSENKINFEPRKMYLRDIWHPVTSEKIDKGLVVCFKEPNSFTGENVCELHLHGGPAVITSLMDALSTFENSRYAEPGEFSRRAFLNGRMDLVEVEAVHDLVNAETEMQRKQALSQMEGSLSKIYKEWREIIVKCLANFEAYIDFNEDENIEDNVLEDVDIRVKNLINSIELHLNDNRRGERLRNGVRVVIIGQPNAGKSSLLNSISKKPTSIVSPIPGTTRDVIEIPFNIAGYPIVLSDTAGLRHSTDVIEIEGVKRAMKKIEDADLLLVVIDLKEHLDYILKLGIFEFLKIHLNEQLKLNFSSENENNSFENWLLDKQIIISLNKKDLIKQESINLLNKKLVFDNSELNEHISINKISSIDNDDKINDINDLLQQLKFKVSNLCSNSMSEMPSLTQQRHRDNLTKCVKCLKTYLEKMENSSNNSEHIQDLALIAEELRIAARWLGKITGHVTSEQVLDVIFRDFCIGK